MRYEDDGVLTRREKRGIAFDTVDLGFQSVYLMCNKLCWLAGVFNWALSYPFVYWDEVTESRLDREGMIPRLWIALSPEQRALLTDAIATMPDAHVYRLKTLLARLPDDRYLRVVDILENASKCQLNHYLVVCGTTRDFTPADKASSNNGGDIVNNVGEMIRTVPKNEQYIPAVLSGKEWLELQDRIWKLPAELQMEIEEKLYEAAFCPGKIFPHQFPRANGKFRDEDRFYDPPAPRVFSALNRKTYAKYHREFWSGNTFVIGTGDASSTMGFLSGDRPDSAAKAIRSIELRFTTKDCGYDASLEAILDGTVTPHDVSKKIDMLDMIEEYQAEAPNAANELYRTSFKKLRILAQHQGLEALSDLTLDFTQAHGLDGVFLGVEFASQNALSSFVNGLPPNFTIKAPTDVERDQILAFFVAKNS